MAAGESRLPAVAEIDFLHPIEADFGRLKADGLKVLNTLIYQCIYGFSRWFFVASQAKRYRPCGT
jgi:hypothetical protein